jgi:hypothetical protein
MPQTLKQLLVDPAFESGGLVKLHLGVGATMLPGYINIDYPPEAHNVMAVAPDVQYDVKKLVFPPGSVDEIRMHHVFEHFNRVEALGLLVRWHEWLKPGGLLWLETPDMMATVAAACSLPVVEQIALARHLEGDQAASWAYHIVQWFPGRFQRTLAALGFADIETVSERSPWHALPLFNVTAKARKGMSRPAHELRRAARELLADSLVSPSETQTLAVWQAQFDAFMELRHVEARAQPISG